MKPPAEYADATAWPLVARVESTRLALITAESRP
jgi:hypothetical protein